MTNERRTIRRYYPHDSARLSRRRSPLKYLLLVTLLAVSCGRYEGKQGPKGDPGQTGATGSTGPQGSAGFNGSSCRITDPNVIFCTDGSSYTIPAGQKGDTGAAGPAGVNGSSCSTQPTATGALMICSDGTRAEILNGEKGADATSTPYTVTQVISPCPNSNVPYHEVLLKLQNGELLAHYDDGAIQFLTLLPPGNYQLTDGSGCNITVADGGTVTWQGE